MNRSLTASAEPEAPVSARPTRPRPVRPDHPVRAVALLVAALALFSCSDLCAKILNRSLSPIEIAWLRYATFSVLVVTPALWLGRLRFSPADLALQVLRGLGLLGSAVFFICAIRVLPLADATATAFISPLFITALSIPILGEKVGIRRWGAVVVGLAGVLLIVRPFSQGFQPASAFPVLSAASWACAAIVTRLMVAGRDGVLATLAWSALTGLFVLSVAVCFVYRTPTPRELGLGVLMGTVNAAAQWLTVLAYRSADASLLAPFSYSQLLWATTFGFLFFGALPDRWTVVGMAVIIASGTYTAHRERAVRRAQAA